MAVVKKNNKKIIIDARGNIIKFSQCLNCSFEVIQKIKSLTLDDLYCYDLIKDKVLLVKDFTRKLEIKKDSGEKIILDASEVEQAKRLIK